LGSEPSGPADVVLELRDLVEQLEAAELPKGFGRVVSRRRESAMLCER
jgi:hypothetical protein